MHIDFPYQRNCGLGKKNIVTEGAKGEYRVPRKRRSLGKRGSRYEKECLHLKKHFDFYVLILFLFFSVFRGLSPLRDWRLTISSCRYSFFPFFLSSEATHSHTRNVPGKESKKCSFISIANNTLPI